MLTASAIKKALEDLGYINIYHASDIFRNPHDAEKWTAALEARYEEKGKEFGREEFDDILGNYSVRNRPLLPDHVHELTSF